MSGTYNTIPESCRLAEPTVRLLKRWFLNRTDVVAFAPPWDAEACPAVAGDNLDRLLLGHLLGDDVPEVTVHWKTKSGKSGQVKGRPRIGTYCPDAQGQTRFACIDCDGGGRHSNPLADPRAAALSIVAACRHRALAAHLECSGSGNGWHVWILIDEPVPAVKVRRLIFSLIPEGILLADGTPADPRKGKGIEVFPKQDSIDSDGLGNFVWLPFWHGAAAGGNRFYAVNQCGELRPFFPEQLEGVSEASLDNALSIHGEDRPSYNGHLVVKRDAGEQEGRVPRSVLLKKYLDLAKTNRNDKGFALACQLRDNGYTKDEAKPVLLEFQEALSKRDNSHAYTKTEALSSLGSAYSKSPRSPWESTDTGSSRGETPSLPSTGATTIGPTPGDWEDPTPLTSCPKMPPFPTDCLPPWMGDWVEAESEACQTPTDLAATLSLANAGAALAKKIRIMIRPGWTEPTNIFGVVALPPGDRKSAVLGDCLVPVQIHESELQQRMAPLIAEAASEHRMLEIRVKEAERKASKAEDASERQQLAAEARALAKELDAHVVPEPPQLYCDDVTPEKLANLLAHQEGRMLVASAEGTCFEIIKGRYSDGPNLDVYLKGHAGDPLRVNRISRERDIVDRPALSLSLTVQPDVISGLGEQAVMRGRGLLARPLYAIPESLVGTLCDILHPVPPPVAA